MTQVIILFATQKGDSQVFRLFSGLAHNRDVIVTVFQRLLADRPAYIAACGVGVTIRPADQRKLQGSVHKRSRDDRKTSVNIFVTGELIRLKKGIALMGDPKVYGTEFIEIHCQGAIIKQ